jgi:outer membrane protein OmpA-like peptidoglycan-associated protein
MTNPICIAADAAPRPRPAARIITLASLLVLAALAGACATKTNTGATVAERSFGARTSAKTASGDVEGTTGASSTAADGSQAGAGGRSSSAGAGATGDGRSADGTSGGDVAGGDSSLYGDSEDEGDSADDFTGIAGDEAAGGDGAGGTAAGARPGSRPGSRAPGTAGTSPGDDTSASTGQGSADGASMQDGTSATGAGGRRASADGSGGAAGADGAMAGGGGGGDGADGSGRDGANGSGRDGADGSGRDGSGGSEVAGGDYGSDGTSAGGTGAAGRRSSGAGGGASDAAAGAGSDEEAMVVGMVDAPGSRVRIEEDVTPQTLGGMLPLAVGVDEEGQFDFDQAVLRPEVKSVLDELAGRLRDAEWDRLDIIGYTDRIGTDDYNQQLSERRAWAVARYLLAQGVPVSKMKVAGRGERNSQVNQGECHDLERSELIACLQQDRRVEIEASIRKTEAKIQ